MAPHVYRVSHPRLRRFPTLAPRPEPTPPDPLRIGPGSLPTPRPAPRPGPRTCSTAGRGLCGRSFIFSPRLRRPLFCLQIFRHSGQQGGSQPGTRCVLKQRVQKSWPQSSEMGSRSLSRQMEQAGSSRGAAGRDPRPSSNLGNGVWDLGGGAGSRAVGTVLPAGRSLDGVLTLPQGHRHRAATGELLHRLI